MIRKWTKEAVALEAKKYNAREEWKNNSSGSHNAAQRNGWLKELSTHMKTFKKYSKKNKKAIFSEAKKYRSRSEWQLKNAASYAIAVRCKWLPELYEHFKNYKTPSAPQCELTEYVRKFFPTAYSRRINDKNKNKCFEIDIFIPELNKGIEFDGTYWHSIAGLKRSHPTWSEIDIQNYHQIKDEFFMSKGIELMHIKEKEWLKNKDKQLLFINKFLGV